MRAVSSDAPVALRWHGPLAALTPDDRRGLFERTASTEREVRERTTGIVDRVRSDGDDALRALAVELDGVTLDEIEVPRSEWARALAALEPELRRAMERATANIERVHGAFMPSAQETESEPGVVVGRRPDPLRRVGVYAPGGRAAYPAVS